MDHFWSSIPPDLREKGYFLCLFNDFYGSEHYPLLSRVRATGMGQKFNGVDSGAEPIAKSNGRGYEGHTITGLDDPETTSDRRLIRTREDLLEFMNDFLTDRHKLQDRYEDVDIPGVYQRPNHLEFSAWPCRLNQQEEIGDKSSYLCDHLNINKTPPGDCVFKALVDHLATRRPPIRTTVQDLRNRIGKLKGGLGLDELYKLEALEFKGTSSNAKPHQFGFVVFDSRFNLIRLPPYFTGDTNNYQYYVSICIFNKHAYSFQSLKFANSVRQKALSYFSAVLQVHHGSEEPFTAEGYELFLEVQRLGLHPDTEAIDTYLEINFNFHPSAYLHLKYISKSQMRWQPIPGGRNEDLARWMEESGSEIYYDDKPGHHPATWAKAVGEIRTHAVFLKTFSDFKKVVGIGPLIQGVVQQAPWDQFRQLVLPEIKPPPQLEIERKVSLYGRASSESIPKTKMQWRGNGKQSQNLLCYFRERRTKKQNRLFQLHTIWRTRSVWT